jgi:transposase
MLYNEPDFTNIKSTLELACESHKISVLFLPKFHCELSFIEQCLGHAKRMYRLQPPSTSEDALAKNLVNTLESVTVEQMRK